MKTVIFAALGLFGLAAGLAFDRAAAQTATSAPPPTVGVITAAKQPVYDEQSYVGRIQSPSIVQLNARVTGFLEAQDFLDGDTVAQGQLLYVIEQPPYQAAVAQAQAAVLQAQATARNANLTLGRAQALLNTPAGLPASVDSSRAAATGGNAQIASAEAQLQTAQINLGYTEIRSPIGGRISATNVNVGNVVGPSSGPLATIVSQDPMYVDFAVPVVDAQMLRAEAAAEGGFANALDVLVRLPDGSMYNQTGRLDFINNQVTANTDTLAMRATIANPVLPHLTAETGQHTLQDGEFVNVVLRSREAQQRITVPQEAVVSDQLGSYVMVVDPDGTVRRQAVAVGQSTPSAVAITSGLKPGDQVIVQGAQRVHPGTKVKTQPANSTKLPPAGQE
jgi:membrane fusion protein (multidrug efflux system)